VTIVFRCAQADLDLLVDHMMLPRRTRRNPLAYRLTGHQAVGRSVAAQLMLA
jgi:hypothetical protein